MDKQKIIIIGEPHLGIIEALKHRNLSDMFEINTVTPEQLEGLKKEYGLMHTEPIVVPLAPPPIVIDSYFKSPPSRKDRRKAERENKKKAQCPAIPVPKESDPDKAICGINCKCQTGEDCYGEAGLNLVAIEESGRSWPEDYPHENGNYPNICVYCKQTFIGHKRRAICKLCNNKQS
jgi:hypothetical protein